MKQAITSLDEAKLVRVWDIGSVAIVQAWFGGTTVNVFEVTETGMAETDVWTLQDSKGRAPEIDEVEQHMEMTMEIAYEEGDL